MVFVKQKTAYEMRISDWSSDVCSSDLFAMRGNVVDLAVGVVIGAAFGKIVSALVSGIIMPMVGIVVGGVNFADLAITLKPGADGVEPVLRSEEHTSELQSLMRISYAVFCLKNK